MALYTWKFTIPANTPKDNAERMEVWVKRGVVVRAKIVIPTGHVGLAKMQIWKGEIPILPENPDGWIFGDGEEVEDIPLWIIGEKEEKFTFVGYNEDDTFEHSFIIRFIVLPFEVIFPLSLSPAKEQVMQELIGVVE